MEMYDVLNKLKAIENPSEDEQAAIKSAEAMNNPTNPSAKPAEETIQTPQETAQSMMPETQEVSATGQDVYQPVAEETPVEYARLAGIQTLNVQTDAPEATNESVEVKEAAKPDFLDLDKDGDKKEPMKKAAKDKEEMKEEDTTPEQYEKNEKVSESKEVVNEATKDIKYGDWTIRHEVGKKDGEPVKWMTWHTDGGPESAIKGQSSSEEKAKMDAKKEGGDSIPALRKAYKGPVKVLSWILTNGGQTDAVLLKKGNEYALGTDLAYMDTVAWWQSSPDAHWEEYTMLAKQHPDQGYWHWKNEAEFKKWVENNPKLYRKNIEFGADITDPESYQYVTDDKNREEVETIELDEAYDPAHVKGIVDKHEKEGHKVQMDRPEDGAQGFTVTFKDGKKRHYKYTKSGVKVQSLEPEEPMVDPDAPKRGKGRPKKESQELNLDGMMEDFEKKYTEQLNEGLQVTQSIDDEGKETVNINANNAHADMIKDLMKLSGMRSDGYKEYEGDPEAVEEEREIEYTNTPREKTTSADAQLKDMSGGVNGPKDKSALKSNSNPLHEKDLAESMMNLYKEYKDAE